MYYIIHCVWPLNFILIHILTAVQETALGHVSKETENFIGCLGRRVEGGICVFATQYEVRIHNCRELKVISLKFMVHVRRDNI